jgi:hypothetical protein
MLHPPTASKLQASGKVILGSQASTLCADQRVPAFLMRGATRRVRMRVHVKVIEASVKTASGRRGETVIPGKTKLT